MLKLLELELFDEKLYSMVKNEILISLITRKNLRLANFGEAFLRGWFQNYPDLAPEFAREYEPVNVAVSCPEDCFEVWPNICFQWKRKRVQKSEGTVFHGNHHFPFSQFNLNASWSVRFDWEDFFLWLSRTLEADFAYLHLITNSERKAPGIDARAAYCFFLGASGKSIEQEGIPNLGWMNVFSDEYAKEQGLDLGISAVSLIGDKQKSLKISPKLDDVIERYNEFFAAREEIKEQIKLNQTHKRRGSDYPLYSPKASVEQGI